MIVGFVLRVFKEDTEIKSRNSGPPEGCLPAVELITPYSHGSNIEVTNPGTQDDDILGCIEPDANGANLLQYIRNAKQVNGLTEWASANRNAMITSIMRDVLTELASIHERGDQVGNVSLENGFPSFEAPVTR